MTERSMKSYLYEGIVIVASILVAFALDASWANYQDAKVERRVLGELHSELESAKARIVSSNEELEIAIDATFELAESLGSNTLALTQDAVDNLFNRIVGINTLEVPTSVLDSIIASGQVRLISSSELSNALSEWPAFVADVRENHEWHRVETDEFLIPHMAQHLSIRDAVIANGNTRLSAGTLDRDILALQRDPVFEGRLIWRASRQEATLRESTVLLAETEKLLSMIAAEID